MVARHSGVFAVAHPAHNSAQFNDPRCLHVAFEGGAPTAPPHGLLWPDTEHAAPQYISPIILNYVRLRCRRALICCKATGYACLLSRGHAVHPSRATRRPERAVFRVLRYEFTQVKRVEAR